VWVGVRPGSGVGRPLRRRDGWAVEELADGVSDGVPRSTAAAGRRRDEELLVGAALAQRRRGLDGVAHLGLPSTAFF